MLQALILQKATCLTYCEDSKSQPVKTAEPGRKEKAALLSRQGLSQQKPLAVYYSRPNCLSLYKSLFHWSRLCRGSRLTVGVDCELQFSADCMSSALLGKYLAGSVFQVNMGFLERR